MTSTTLHNTILVSDLVLLVLGREVFQVGVLVLAALDAEVDGGERENEEEHSDGQDDGLSAVARALHVPHARGAGAELGVAFDAHAAVGAGVAFGASGVWASKARFG